MKPLLALLDRFPTVGDDPREPIHLFQRQTEGFAYVPKRAFGPIADHLRNHGGSLSAITTINLLNDLFTTLVLEVHIDIGRILSLQGHEPLEEQVGTSRVDGGDAQHETDGAVGRAAASLAKDLLLPCDLDDLVDAQKVRRCFQLLDETQLLFDLSKYARSSSLGISPSKPLAHKPAKSLVRAFPRPYDMIERETILQFR